MTDTPTLVDLPEPAAVNATISSSTSETAATVATLGNEQQQTHSDQMLQQTEQHDQSTSGQDETLLMDVLFELDKERSRRAELEDQLKKFKEEREQEKSRWKKQLEKKERRLEEIQQETKTDTLQQPPPPPTAAERHQLVSLQTQVHEYQTLMNALTTSKPAIAYAAQEDARTSQLKSQKYRNTRQTLPLYVVRLLEILPWTPHAHEHVFCKEAIYEWQFLSEHTNDQKQNDSLPWTSQIRVFPQYFKQLPVTRPRSTQEQIVLGNGHLPDTLESSNGNNNNNHDPARGLLVFLAGGNNNKTPNSNNPFNNSTAASTQPSKATVQSTSKHGVITNARVTALLSMEDGYPLPEDGGTWEWIGGWRIEKRVFVEESLDSTSTSTGVDGPATRRQKIDCDQDGWSYAQSIQDFSTNPTELVWDNPGVNGERRLRRRKWSRQRVLVDYPYSSDFTRQYLQLLAENARLTVTTNKISDQLVETKTALTGSEEVLMNEKSHALLREQALKAEIARLQALLRTGNTAPNNSANSSEHYNPKEDPDNPQNLNPIQEFLQKNEENVKGLGNKFQQFLGRHRSDSKDQQGGRSRSNSKEDQQQNSSSPPEAAHAVVESLANLAQAPPTNEDSASNGNSNKFDWKRVVLNKIQNKNTNESSDKLNNAESSSLTDENSVDALELQEGDN